MIVGRRHRRRRTGRDASLARVLWVALSGAIMWGCCGSGSRFSSSNSGPGTALFQTYCAACHQPDGAGSPDGRIPPLAGSPWVRGPQERIVRIVLHGLRGRIDVKGRTYDIEMLAFGPILSDDQVAAILTHVRRQFGEPSRPITPDTVARIRAATADRFEYWTVDELMAVPIGDAVKNATPSEESNSSPPAPPAQPSPPVPADH
jgi:mono/diheme cytochrome c family protein